MKKKFILTVIFIFSIVLLTACSGSKAIQGTWKMQDAAGNNSTITFADKTVTVNGESFDYTQNAIGTENGVSYYGIQQNGEYFSIIFPEKNKDIAIMLKPDSTEDYLIGKMLYVMNKTTEPNYDNYVEKYLQ